MMMLMRLRMIMRTINNDDENKDYNGVKNVGGVDTEDDNE